MLEMLVRRKGWKGMGRAMGLRAQSRARLCGSCTCRAVRPREVGNLLGGFSPLPQGNNHRPHVMAL